MWGLLIIMSRIGQNPVLIPEGVKVSLEDSVVKVSGPNGSLEFNFRKEMIISQNDGLIIVDLQPEEDEDLINELRNNQIDLIRLITPTTNKESKTEKIILLNIFIIYSFNKIKVFHKYVVWEREIND